MTRFKIRVAEALILGTMMVGQATAFAPNYNKAVVAAARIFRLLDRRPKIDSTGASGLKLVRIFYYSPNQIDFNCMCVAVGGGQHRVPRRQLQVPHPEAGQGPEGPHPVGQGRPAGWG